MAKQSGLGDRLFVSGWDFSVDIGSVPTIQGGNSPLEVTGITRSAIERIGGQRDGSMEVAAFFNPAAGQAHDRFSPLPYGDQIYTYCRGTTLGNPAASLVSKQLNYDGTRAADGAFTFAVSSQGNGYGLEWGRQLTAGTRTDAGATNGASVDFGTGSTTFGLQAYLHVFAFTGTDATVTIQESSDDGGGDAFTNVAGGSFTQVTAGPTYERIQTARNQTVERYLRAVTTTTGGFTNLQFAVMVSRNDTLTAF